MLHSDMAQTFCYLPASVRELGVDCATFSGHKMYSSKGVGALYVRDSQLVTKNAKQGSRGGSGSGSALYPSHYTLSPMLTGGGQEFGFRSGTENVPLIVGLAKAMELAEKNREKESERIKSLKQYFWKELQKIDQKAIVNGSESGLPHILNLALSRPLAADLLVYLDLRGVAVSTGSACAARSPQPSHVLQVMGLSKEKISKSVRFSFGRATDKKQIDTVIRLINLSLRGA
ncbi:MAG: aminotransferase class V-fold PLP-dependent enzyme [Patescibacteria group bacterium]